MTRTQRPATEAQADDCVKAVMHSLSYYRSTKKEKKKKKPYIPYRIMISAEELYYKK
jgi:hypothetical protein